MPVGLESKKVTETAAIELEIERRCFRFPRTCIFLQYSISQGIQPINSSLHPLFRMDFYPKVVMVVI